MRQTLSILFGKYPAIDSSSFGSFFTSLKERWVVSQRAREFTKMIRALVVKAFEPCAYHHEDLDMLVVQTKDCSYTLSEKPPYYGGVMYDNHAEEKTVVGFQIYGIKAFLRQKGSQRQESYDVSNLVNDIAESIAGGLETIFGEAEDEVRNILSAYPALQVPVRF